MKNVLLIDDDNSFLNSVTNFLKRSGFGVVQAKDGKEGLKALDSKENIDIIVVDLLMPVIDGTEFCKEVRKKESSKDIPILMLTALSDISDKFVAFESGADDYLTKPFEPLELLLRIKSLIKRNKIEKKQSQTSISNQSGTIKLDKRKSSIYILEKNIRLTISEFLIVEYLFKRKDTPVSSEELLEKVIGGNSTSGDTSTIRFHVKNIRKKIEKEPSTPKILINIQGLGYTISETALLN